LLHKHINEQNLDHLSFLQNCFGIFHQTIWMANG
jgi:hypothetical protein